jgi:mannose-6-phosphate isomerase
MTSSSSHTDAAVDLYPLTFDPVFKDYPWGGRSLATVLGARSPTASWRRVGTSPRTPTGRARSANGPLAGKTLPEADGTAG